MRECGSSAQALSVIISLEKQRFSLFVPAFSGTRSITVRFVGTRYFAAAALICAAVTFSNGVNNELICCGSSRKSASDGEQVRFAEAPLELAVEV